MGLEVKVEGLTPVKTKVNWGAPLIELNGILVEVNGCIFVIEDVWTDRKKFRGRCIYSSSSSPLGATFDFDTYGDYDVYYLEGQWSAFYKIIRGEEEKVSDEIDWTVTGQLLISEASGSIVLYERLVDNDGSFKGSVIFKASDAGGDVGYISDQFAKSFFKPFRGTVILTQK